MEQPAQPVGAPSRSAALTWLMIGVAALAIVVRFLAVQRGGGLFGMSDYDGSVYFTGADSILSGRVPYNDFVLLHPPGILVILAPFAALGRLIGDPWGFAVARLAFMALGALNAVLLVKLAGRVGFLAAAAAGISYAVWYPSMYAERTTLLEPLGTTAILVSLVLMFQVQRVTPRAQLLIGVVIGLGATVKIWGVVPIAVFVLWELYVRGWRASARVAAGAAAAITVVCLPFFALAPGSMFRMVVLDQIGRPVIKPSIVGRLSFMSSLNIFLGGSGRLLTTVIVLSVGLLALACALYNWRDPSLRIVTLLLFAVGGVLLESPSYYLHYAEFVAAPGALTIAIATQRLFDWATVKRRQIVRYVTIAAVALPLAGLTVYAAARMSLGERLIWVHKDTVAAVKGCVYANDPAALIEFNVLSSDLKQGCHVWVDLTGLTYEPRVKHPNGVTHPVKRINNPVWQHDLYAYLKSGSTTILLTRPNAVLSKANLAKMRKDPLLAQTKDYQIFARN